MKSTCIRCKFFKIEDTMNGYCRVQVKETGNRNGLKPMVNLDDSCDKWADCGQQYYIRRGWIKSQEALKKKKLPQ